MPNLGVVTAGDTTFTVADVPGLIEGASEGRGLGHDFLRHVERCAAIVHVVDTATIEPGRNPVDDLDVIEHELASYGGLEDRPRLVALNKIDVPDGREIADIVRDDLEERGLRVFAVSAASGEGLRELTFAMAEIVRRARAPRTPVAEAERIVHPPAVGRRRRRLHGHATDRPTGWRVRGAEARALGAPDRLQQRRGRRLPRRPAQPARRRDAAASSSGAVEGDAVLIGHPDNAVVFDFKPGIDAGVEMLGRRGEDQRFEESRPAARRRRDDRRGHARARRGRDPRRRRPPARPARAAADELRDRLRRRPRLRPRPRRATGRMTGGPRASRSPRPAGSWSRSARRR